MTVRFEVRILTAISMKKIVFGDVRPCGLVDRKMSEERATCIFRRVRHHVPPKPGPDDMASDSTRQESSYIHENKCECEHSSSLLFLKLEICLIKSSTVALLFREILEIFLIKA
jgi:hypothetical protein